jgi:hypothetical protein
MVVITALKGSVGTGDEISSLNALSSSIFILYSLGSCGKVVRLLAVVGPRLIGGRPQVGAGVHQRAAAAARIGRGHQILGYYAGIRLADVGLVLTTATTTPRVGGGGGGDRGNTGIVVGGMIGLGHTAAAGWIGLAHTAAAHVGLGAAVQMGCRSSGSHYSLCGSDA